MSPKLSVIIASYNHERYIARTLRSLEEQSFQDFEIIIIDDGSVDTTVEVVRKANSRAQIITQSNAGVNITRNRAVERSKGQYLCFVDSDDVEHQDRFAQQVLMLDSDPDIGLVFADSYIIDDNPDQEVILGKFSDTYPVIPGDVAENLITQYCFVPFATTMIRKDIFVNTGLFESDRYAMGHMKWIEIAYLTKAHYDSTPLAHRRRHEKNVSRLTKKEDGYRRLRESLTTLLQKYPELKQSVGSGLNKRFAKTYFLTGFFYGTEGDIQKARTNYKQALRINPLSPVYLGAAMLVAMPCKKAIIALHRHVKARKLPSYFQD